MRLRSQSHLEEKNFRPASLDDFVGQGQIKKPLKNMIKAAQTRGTPIEHVCFYGPPGLGKTTLANIIAGEMGGNLKELAAPSIQKLGDLVSVLASLQVYDVLFLDEIHRLKMEMAEILYSAMEDFKISITIGGEKSGTEAKAITIPLKPFTLVGATTNWGLMPAPLRDRFGMAFPLNLYSAKELEMVVLRASTKAGLLIDEDSCHIIAVRSRGTPRIALRLFRRAADLALNQDLDIEKDVALETMEMLSIDEHGLDKEDRRLLETMAVSYRGRPVGPKALCASLGIDQNTLEESMEPWLLQSGLLVRTRKGRQLTRKGWVHIGKHLGLKIPELEDETMVQDEKENTTAATQQEGL